LQFFFCQHPDFRERGHRNLFVSFSSDRNSVIAHFPSPPVLKARLSPPHHFPLSYLSAGAVPPAALSSRIRYPPLYHASFSVPLLSSYGVTNYSPALWLPVGDWFSLLSMVPTSTSFATIPFRLLFSSLTQIPSKFQSCIRFSSRAPCLVLPPPFSLSGWTTSKISSALPGPLLFSFLLSLLGGAGLCSLFGLDVVSIFARSMF